MDRQDIIRHRHLIDYLFNQQVKSYLYSFYFVSYFLSINKINMMFLILLLKLLYLLYINILD
jgi:hypothetical protein